MGQAADAQTAASCTPTHIPLEQAAHISRRNRRDLSPTRNDDRRKGAPTRAAPVGRSPIRLSRQDSSPASCDDVCPLDLVPGFHAGMMRLHLGGCPRSVGNGGLTGSEQSSQMSVSSRCSE